MNLLVTGGSGFIGSNFIRYMLKRHPDYYIVNLDKLTYAGNPENLRDVEDEAGYTFVQGDICNHELVKQILKERKIDVVVNFAAETHVDRSIGDPHSFIRTDVLGTHSLLEAARKLNVKKFVQISTDEVYGSIAEGAFTEESPLNPSSPYSASKAGGDLLARSYFVTYNLPVVITRSSNNFGPYQYPEKLIPLFITSAIERQSLPVYGDGKQVRDWLFVLDNCEAIDIAIHKGVNGEIYNIGADNERTNLEITLKILRLLNMPETLIKHVIDRPGHDRRYSVNSKKIRNLGWMPRHGFESALKHTVEWYLSNMQWWAPLKSIEYKEYYKKLYYEKHGLKKKVLVLGALGMLGSDIMAAFKEHKQYEVYGWGKADLDITDKNAVLSKISLLHPDIVINAAAYTKVDAVESDREKAMLVNGFAVKCLVDACKKCNAELVHISTDYVFDGEKAGGYMETNAPRPINAYGESKALGEKYLMHDFDKFFLIRTSWLFGKNGQNFVNTMLRLADSAEADNPISVVDDQRGSPTYTKHLALKILEVIEGGRHGIYHITNSGACTWYEFAKKILEITAINAKIVPTSSSELGRPAIRPKNSTLINSKLIEYKIALLPEWSDAVYEYLTEIGRCENALYKVERESNQ